MAGAAGQHPREKQQMSAERSSWMGCNVDTAMVSAWYVREALPASCTAYPTIIIIVVVAFSMACYILVC